MEWSKVKTILILVLFGVNLFMLLSLAKILNDEKIIQKDSLETAISIANKNGLEVSDGDIPVNLEGVVTYEIPRNEKMEAKLASSLIGKYSVESPGADTTIYRGEKGEATFRSSGHFEIKMIGDFEIPKNEGDAKTYALKIANVVGIDPLNNYVVIKGGSYRVHLKQGIRQKEVINSDMEIQFYKDHIELIGRWVFGDPLSTGETPKNTSELVLDLVNELKKQNLLPDKIKSIQTGYVAGAATVGRIKLQPVWSIECEKGQYNFDIVRGTLVFVE
ncbi:MAG: hypothetical protein N2Z65_00810 [Clostridiales bacterium]|nr:hypothetical protein [Clostridiales bacterium]